MSYKQIKSGDIFIISSIDIGNEKISLAKNTRLGKVIFVSKRTKGMIGLLISKFDFENIPIEIDDIEFVNKILYADWYYLRNGNWKIVGHQVVTEAEEDLTIRLTGTNLWRLDEYLGVIPKSELKKYNKQLQYGFKILYSTIDQL